MTVAPISDDTRATCAHPGCTEPPARCYRTTSEALARLCAKHRHIAAVVASHRKRVARGWVPGSDRSVRVYDTELRGVALATPAGVRWLLARGQRIVATRGGYESRVAAECACDVAAGRGARR